MNVLSLFDGMSGGSPCQGFSFAGKQLNFNDPRSRLFFEFEKALNALRPEKFFLENVLMKKEHEQVITNYLGVDPIKINSALVSAQMRKRNYWANWLVEQPSDRGISLKDVLEDAPSMSLHVNVSGVKEVHSTEKYIQWDMSGRGHRSQNMRAHYACGKSPCVMPGSSKAKVIRPINEKSEHSFIVLLGEAYIGTHAIQTNLPDGNYEVTKLSPVECERLQGMPDNFTACAGKTARYEMLGNGWQIDTVAHCFSTMLD